MDSYEVEIDLVEGSERLICLTNVLNLEDYDKTSDPRYQMNPVVDDFVTLRDHICERRKIICSYGLDNQLFDEALFRKMEVLASRLFYHSGFAEAYCNLKSSLVLEVNEFFDEVLTEMDIRLNSSTSDAEVVRLVRCAGMLKDIYQICL